MRKMIALLPALALVFFSAAALTGCGTRPPPPPPPAAETPPPLPPAPPPPPVPAAPPPETPVSDLSPFVSARLGPDAATLAGLAADAAGNAEGQARRARAG